MNCPAVNRKNHPGRKVWFKDKDGLPFAVNMGGRRAAPKPQRPQSYSTDYMVVVVDEKTGKHRGWIRYGHRLERKRRAL